MREYPTQAIDVAHRTLLNMAAKHPYYGHQFRIQTDDHRIGFDRTAYISGKLGFIPLLIDFQYIHAETYQDCHLCTITALGWQKVEELRKQEQTVRQGFVAMAFRDEAKPIRESFRTAITSAGYRAVILDEKEHNNQIVPEIFYEIRQSKFVVVDVTYPNYGAYYEAGFAQALGKQVIICCREDVYNDSSKQPHFDIAQQSIIVWKDHEDLVRRLKRRIEVTVQ
jgi:nucleoside 2-deoxyribosyltransferase